MEVILYGYGIQAITAQNGWAMAFAGAVIVICGLAVLATVISQLHKVASFVDHRFENRPSAPSTAAKTPATEPKGPFCILDDADAIYRPLAEDLGETFELKDLYDSANRNQLPHVHLTIRSLRECGHICPAADGRFCWKS
jgi:hypothetical protein